MQPLVRTSSAALVGIALGLVATCRSAAGAPPIELGKPFPDLVLPALDDGRPLSIADFRGEKVVLVVFASW